MLEYRSTNDLNKLIIRNLGRFDRDFDLIVGVPRSGMLPATLLALYLNLPLTDIDSYINKRVTSGGQRLAASKRRLGDALSKGPRKVLIIDDSLFSGNAMSIVKEKINQMGKLEDKVLYAVIYIHPQQVSKVDIWLECIESRVFEWNILNHNILTNSCVDIDGVLCRDPSEKENDDASEYLHFLKTVSPLNQPAFEIGWLVTSRLEKYRKVTEQWLSEHRIAYKNLVMLNLPTKEERIARSCHAEFKANVYKKTAAILFIESSSRQAIEIARLSHRPVFCNETREMLYHTSVEQLKRHDAIRRTFPVRFVAWITRPIRNAIRSR